MNYKRYCVLVALLLLLPGIAFAQQTTGGNTPNVSNVTSFLSSFSNTATSIANTFIGAAPTILGASLAIRILMVVIPALLDGDLADMVSQVIQLGLKAGILMVIISNWTGGTFNIQSRINSVSGDMLSVMSSAQGSGQTFTSATDIITYTYNSVATSTLAVWNLVMTFPTSPPTATPPSGSGIGATVASAWNKISNMAGTAMGVVMGLIPFLFACAVGIVAAAVTVVLFVVLMIEAGVGMVYMLVPIAFGPLILSLNLLVPSWTDRLISVIATGIARLGAAAMIVSIDVNVIQQLTAQFKTQTSSFQASDPTGDMLSQTGKVGYLLGYIAICLFMTFISKAFVASVSDLFGGSGKSLGAGRGQGIGSGAMDKGMNDAMKSGGGNSGNTGGGESGGGGAAGSSGAAAAGGDSAAVLAAV